MSLRRLARRSGTAVGWTMPMSSVLLCMALVQFLQAVLRMVLLNGRINPTSQGCEKLDVLSQVLSIKDRRNGVGKPAFKLAPLGNGQVFAHTAPDRHVPVFLGVCCNKSSLKPARPLCDGRPFASPLFRRLAGRGSFFRGFPFRWALQFVVSLVHCTTFRDLAPCTRKDSLNECSRPCDALSCLFVTALWLRQSQSILLQVQQANDIAWTCFKTLPIESVTCLQVVLVSLE